jgi:hypothetical protein
MPAFAPVTEWDYYWIAAELHVAEPDRWAATVPHAQIVRWRAFYRRRQQLAAPQPPGPGGSARPF